MAGIAVKTTPATESSLLKYGAVQISVTQSDLQTFAQYMFELMLRNVASDGFVFTDPVDTTAPPTKFSTPGCIIASPSYEQDLVVVDQDYVFNWTRDSAITAMELAAANMPTRPGEAVPQPLIDYVNFARTCQKNAQNNGGTGWASYTIEGQPRPKWSAQSDGPALQTLAILQILKAYPQLDTQTRGTAQAVIADNVKYLLDVYQNPTTNLWEEQSGLSFFARSVQLRCFQEIKNNTNGVAVPAGIDTTITGLKKALQDHWNGTYYVTLLPQIGKDNEDFPYDPNSDIVMASIYGAVSCTDPQLLATAAQIRSYWEAHYPINATDQANTINGPMGPMVGRYPGDRYDGDVKDPVIGGHPWAPCTANFAQLYYMLAKFVSTNQKMLTIDSLSAPFFNQIGIDATTPLATAVLSLQNAGDMMLNALVYHSDHLELSEQFDGTSGYEKSVSDLTWSYAAFLSALRAKTESPAQG
jgi:glucoamylase